MPGWHAETAAAELSAEGCHLTMPNDVPTAGSAAAGADGGIGLGQLRWSRRRAGHRAGFGFRTPARSFPLHGSVVRSASGGETVTVEIRNDEAGSVSRSSITLKSENGCTRTYVVTDSTAIDARRNGIGPGNRGPGVGDGHGERRHGDRHQGQGLVAAGAWDGQSAWPEQWACRSRGGRRCRRIISGGSSGG